MEDLHVKDVAAADGGDEKEHNGDLTGGAQIVAEERRVGTGALSTVDGGYVDVPDSADLNEACDLTLSAFVRPVEPAEGTTQPDEAYIIKHAGYALKLVAGEGGAGPKVRFWWHLAGGPEWETPGWDKFDSSANIPLGQWSHVAATRAGTTLKIYINGIETDTRELASDRFYQDQSNLRLGEGFHGFIDDARVYHHSLPADQIEAFAATPTPEPLEKFKFSFTLHGEFKSTAANRWFWGTEAQQKAIEAFQEVAKVTTKGFLVKEVVVV